VRKKPYAQRDHRNPRWKAQPSARKKKPKKIVTEGEFALATKK